MKSIAWIASYPKSGNTWMRIFLANYIGNPEEPLSINNLPYLDRMDASGNLYKLVSKGSYDASNPIQSTKLRPAVLKVLVSNGANINFLKTHCGNSTVYGVRLIPPELTRCAIYIMRNPLDMIVSYAKHYNISYDKAIYSTGNPKNALRGGSNNNNAYQFLGSWNNHVSGWTGEKDFPVLSLRYEDMLKNRNYPACFSSFVLTDGLPSESIGG